MNTYIIENMQFREIVRVNIHQTTFLNLQFTLKNVD